MELRSLGELAIRFEERQLVMREALERGLEKALKRIEKTAHDELGHYQAAVGPFPEWEQLTEGTQAEREAAGYTPNDPLLRSGEMQESLGHEVDRSALEGVVGATSEVAPFMEFGTSRVPPRPFLGPAGFRNVEAIKKLVGAAAIAGLIGEDQVHAALGYDVDIGDDGAP